MFIEKPASSNSLSNRGLICGVGVNDASYVVQPMINGRQLTCPFYQRWKSMISRCYDRKSKRKLPTYKDCYVHKEWLIFSNFKSWMEKQDWKEKDLDKDILEKGNKVYSPETCLFVSHKENTVRASAKKYKFINPCGDVVEVHNLTEFCRENKLDQPTMCKVNKGIERQHKGWFSS